MKDGILAARATSEAAFALRRRKFDKRDGRPLVECVPSEAELAA